MSQYQSMGEEGTFSPRTEANPNYFDFKQVAPSLAFPFIINLNCSNPKLRNRSRPQSYMGDIDQPPPVVPECIKLLRLPGYVTSLAYGPYDNGYLLMGTSTGHLLVLEPMSLNRIAYQQCFIDDEITQIKFEPTQTVFLGTKNGYLKAINIIKQEL